MQYTRDAHNLNPNPLTRIPKTKFKTLIREAFCFVVYTYRVYFIF